MFPAVASAAIASIISIEKGEKIRFESQREAARNLKICQSSIGRCLNGEFKQAKGWCFEWLR